LPVADVRGKATALVSRGKYFPYKQFGCNDVSSTK